MAINSLGGLWAALASGDWALVLGTEETSWLDFKSEPYKLSQPKDSWELAKDVASLANTGGGVIVIGFRTERSDSAASDIATEHRPVPRTQVKAEQIIDIVAKRVYPRVTGLELRWFPEKDEKAVLVIEVPSQDERKKPFVVEGTLGDDGRFHSGTLGWPRREGARVEWVRAIEVHNILGDGLSARSSTHLPAQTEMLSLVEQMTRGYARCEQVVAEMEWTDVAHVLIQVLPPLSLSGGRLPGFHEESGVRGHLREAASLRGDNGFNLDFGIEPTIREGTLTFLSDPQRFLWLDLDGTVTIGGAVTEDWLGWRRRQSTPTPGVVRFNPLALVEFSIEAFRLVHRTVVSSAEGVWRFLARIRNFRRPESVQLRPGPLQPLSGRAWSESSPNNGEMPPVELRSPGRDAFEFLSWLYSLFGLPTSGIPYAENDAISEALVRAGGQR